ncbi:MAG: DUF1847 domain-containing protein [Desulfarculaceae bacterium]|nr:DUF1847 domain-containing protein [Desulfarculaceae bacterium]MCF8047080.1 DUF1847 domain-containing protein [Desulfarculaceae bacterium]MCF8123926.1 DUF1847 domain-containing protein [Desulfarculaceae bacterium]
MTIRKRACVTPGGVGGNNCPTQEQAEALEAANAKYDSMELREFARQASLQEAACYANRHERPYVLQPSKTRIQEIWEFAHRMGYTKVGLAFCLGLVNEAAKVEQIFKSQGLEVVSAICKAGATPKEWLGLSDEEKVRRDGFESVCNPLYQAELMNQAGTQLNVVLGLCVGHDSLFFANAKAPSTVLAVKDRVTGHNPLAAVYLSESYYAKLKETGSQDDDGVL